MSKTLEVRMYTRDGDGFTELYFMDANGEPRVVAQLEPGAMQVAVEHAEEVHNEARPRIRRWSMAHLLQKAAGDAPLQPPAEMPEIPWPAAPPPPLPQHDPPEMDDNMRRRAAKELVRRAVIDASQLTADGQARYELALQAHNGNVEALEMFGEEAKVAGLAGKDLAQTIITERRRRERRMMHVHAIQAQAFIDLDRATGDGISAVEQHAVAQIRQESMNNAT